MRNFLLFRFSIKMAFEGRAFTEDDMRGVSQTKLVIIPLCRVRNLTWRLTGQSKRLFESVSMPSQQNARLPFNAAFYCPGQGHLSLNTFSVFVNKGFSCFQVRREFLILQLCSSRLGVLAN